MLIIFNVDPPIGNKIGNGIIQRLIRVGICELFLVSTHSLLLLPIVSLPTSWYIQPAYYSLLPPFWFHRHLGIDLYKLWNSTNESKLSWQGNSYYSRYKQHSCCTPLFLRDQLTLISSKFYFCITNGKYFENIHQ